LGFDTRLRYAAFNQTSSPRFRHSRPNGSTSCCLGIGARKISPLKLLDRAALGRFDPTPWPSPDAYLKPLGHKRVTAAERKRRRRKLLPHLKIFLQKRLPQKGYPLSGEGVFGQVFGRGGKSNFQNPTVPPTRGSRLPRARPRSFEMRRTGVGANLIAPEVAEPVGRKLGVSHGVLDVLVAEIMLQGTGIVPIVGKLIAARMPQHVRMQRERHPGGLAEPLD
jgi:hypothetical protein